MRENLKETLKNESDLIVNRIKLYCMMKKCDSGVQFHNNEQGTQFHNNEQGAQFHNNKSESKYISFQDRQDYM
jgi:nitrous oxidase accessory protein NosD